MVLADLIQALAIVVKLITASWLLYRAALILARLARLRTDLRVLKPIPRPQGGGLLGDLQLFTDLQRWPQAVSAVFRELNSPIFHTRLMFGTVRASSQTSACFSWSPPRRSSITCRLLEALPVWQC